MGGWRRLHNEELPSLYDLQNIIKLIKSRRIRCTGYVACMKNREMYTTFCLENLKGSDTF